MNECGLLPGKIPFEFPKEGQDFFGKLWYSRGIIRIQESSMKIKEMIATLELNRKKVDTTALLSAFGESLDPANVLPEYPRPQLRRSSYINLNGYWEYAIVPDPIRRHTHTPLTRKAAKTLRQLSEVRKNSKHLARAAAQLSERLNKVAAAYDKKADKLLSDLAAYSGEAAIHIDLMDMRPLLEEPEEWDGRILVPFSPECLLSGVNRVLAPGELLWYRREITYSEIPEGKCLLLHFGAVDEEAMVFVNGRLAAHHHGGYLAFTADITRAMRPGKNILTLCVRDTSDLSWCLRGKQKLDHSGMFYTPQSGIWQTVWMEEVPKTFIRRLEIVPDVDNSSVRIKVLTNAPSNVRIELTGGGIFVDREIFSEESAANARPCFGQANRTAEGNSGEELRIPIEDPQLWSPENPFLYTFAVSAGEDTVLSYFAMRSISVGPDENGIARICLNGKPYFNHGVLDQGYWSDGLYTPPSDEALLYDIRAMKAAGFNTLRKHIKIECMRWYYHCDRLGMLVWQDIPNGGGRSIKNFILYLPTTLPFITSHYSDKHYLLFSRQSARGRRAFEAECRAIVRQLKSVPSIVLWTPFNEGWGQFDALRIADLFRQMDPSRLVDHASGWYDQGGGDINSAHVYFYKLKVRLGKRPYCLTEYGGFTMRVDGHSYSPTTFGYEISRTTEEFQKRFRNLMQEIEGLRKKGLAAAIYTQLSDVEEEVNGLLTFDRRVNKLES